MWTLTEKVKLWRYIITLGEKKELVCVVLGGLVIRSLNAVMLDSLKKTHLCLTPICLTFRSTEIETLILWKEKRNIFFNQNEPILKAQVVDFIFSLPHSLLRQGGTRKTFLLYTALCKHCLFVVLWIFATDCTFIPSSSTFCIQYVQHSSVNTVQLKT